jgi:hypothetical protein
VHVSERKIQASEQAPLPARARTNLYQGVPAEMGDRRSISLFAMFAVDEPEDRIPEGAVLGDDGIVAFLPDVCASRFGRR